MLKCFLTDALTSIFNLIVNLKGRDAIFINQSLKLKHICVCFCSETRKKIKNKVVKLSCSQSEVFILLEVKLYISFLVKPIIASSWTHKTPSYFGHWALEFFKTESQQLPGLQSTLHPGGWWLKVPAWKTNVKILKFLQKRRHSYNVLHWENECRTDV